MLTFIKIVFISVLLSFVSCSTPEMIVKQNTKSKKAVKILSLGDSYTIGQSVCSTCRFPEQLKDSLIKNSSTKNTFSLKVIAETGWTTSNLISAIANDKSTENYDLVTLLIGVNNQYQNKPFTLYETEFPQLVNKAIQLAKGNKNKVIILSIPDYAFTPFGSGNTNITSQIAIYNAFVENYASQNNITFVTITAITQLGLQQPNLVATDGLHPSEIAYSKFVERILPKALEKIN